METETRLDSNAPPFAPARCVCALWHWHLMSGFRRNDRLLTADETANTNSARGFVLIERKQTKTVRKETKTEDNWSLAENGTSV